MTHPLPTIGYISHIVADALRDTTSGINTTQLRAEPNGCVSEPLVFRSDALAKLAEKDAEIARYREVISTIYGLTIGNNDPVEMFVAIHDECQSALKGSEA